jgi:hypothetical protein
MMSHKLGSPEQFDRVEARKKAKRLRDEIEEKLNEADDCFHDMESKAKDLSVCVDASLTQDEKTAAVKLLGLVRTWPDLSDRLCIAGDDFEEVLRKEREPEVVSTFKLTTQKDIELEPARKVTRWVINHYRFDEINEAITKINELFDDIFTANRKIWMSAEGTLTPGEMEQVTLHDEAISTAWYAVDAIRASGSKLRDEMRAAGEASREGSEVIIDFS